jgi:Fur family transcriptional regulator, ferric uptake regulator
MTVAHHAVPVHVPSLVAALGTLRAHGLRISSARRLVLEALFAAEGPVTADEVATGLDGRLPASDLASVYRNLETLEEAGLVQHVHLGHGPGLYALVGRHRGWAVCDACGRRAALTDDALHRIRDVVLQTTGFDARFAHFPIVGLCPDCSGGHHAHS